MAGRIGPEGEHGIHLRSAGIYQVGHLPVHKLRCDSRGLLHCFAGDSVLLLKGFPVDLVQLFLDFLSDFLFHNESLTLIGLLLAYSILQHFVIVVVS